MNLNASNMSALHRRHSENYEKDKANVEKDLAELQKTVKQIETDTNIPENTGLKEKLAQNQGKEVVITLKSGEKKRGQLLVTGLDQGVVSVSIKGEESRYPLYEMNVKSILGADGSVVFEAPEQIPDDRRMRQAILFGKTAGLEDAKIYREILESNLKSLDEDNKKVEEEIDKLPQLYNEACEFIDDEVLRLELYHQIQNYCTSSEGIEWVRNSLEVCKALHDGASVEEAYAKAGDTPGDVLCNFVLSCSLEGEEFYDKYSNDYYDKDKRTRAAGRNQKLIGRRALFRAQKEMEDLLKSDDDLDEDY